MVLYPKTPACLFRPQITLFAIMRFSSTTRKPPPQLARRLPGPQAIIQMYLDSKIHVYQDPGMTKKKIQISAAESQIMEALWRKAPLTPEEIIAATAKPNDWGPGTVRPLITR